MKKIIIMLTLIGLRVTSHAQILKPVIWSYGAKKISSTEAVILLKATIEDGWHVYSVYQKGDGPVKTSLKFKPDKDYSLLGKLIEPKPIKKYEDAFEMDIYYHERSVIFQQKIQMKNSGAVVKGSLEYMVCDDHQCLPAETVNFSIPIK